MKKLPVYVLITPARNEAAYIEQTIHSIINQTVLPEKWIIVSDGSTDGTDEIVQQHQARYPFIELLRRQSSEERNFASKVYAFKDGLGRVTGVEYDFIGNLDADVTFSPFYYEKVLEKFISNPKLGIAGGEVFDFYDNTEHKRYSSYNSVAGAVQLFRRNCYEEVGGYIPISFGNEDSIAEITARMKGWETHSFPELKVLHHRRTGTEGRTILKVRFKQGRIEYMVGYHPFFHIARAIQRFWQAPCVVGSLVRMCGYFWACLERPKRKVPEEFVNFLRQEEFKKMIALLRGGFGN
ncbi:MAG TPA: glycosyltransferase family 2 protein [Thermodesulfobacteriota bacterium]|nr:glycosyltransferase family 2 protein [Thermodesulfobacteriota bacterium]